MTASRLAGPDEQVEPPPAPVFPLLPYACMAYAEHCSRDYAGYVDRLVHADEPLATQDPLGLNMIADMNQAFFSLVWGPIGAVINPPKP